MSDEITDYDLNNIRHMTGSDDRYPKKQWGFRNHFCPGGKDIDSMERLERAGYVKRGRKYNETNVFHATRKGCEVIGMKAYQIRNTFKN